MLSYDFGCRSENGRANGRTQAFNDSWHYNGVPQVPFWVFLHRRAIAAYKAL